MDFQGKRVLVLGAGISGMSVSTILKRLGAEVTLSDSRSEEKINKDFSLLRNAGVRLSLGDQDERLLSNVDYVVLSPGISINTHIVDQAHQQGIIVMSEIEVAYRICSNPIVAVTGTNGKTTTTTLIGEMIKTTNPQVVVGGNIGQALSHEVFELDSSGIVVAELSSFQLEGALNFRPHIAAILNVTPDHLDRHRTMDNYIGMKEKIFSKQTDEDYLILNYDDETVRNMAQKAVSQVVFFSRSTVLQQGISVIDGVINIRWKGETIPVCPIADMQLKGAHNVENALAACGAAFFTGVKASNMANVLRSFRGVEHRIEPVATIDGVAYFNDSKATNPESAIKALEAFPGNIILIAGGRDKKTDLNDFMNIIKKNVDHLILIGEAKTRFKDEAIAHDVPSIHQAESMEEAVKLAHSLAKSHQVVLLSPACSSYDMFNNYEERGRAFKSLVNQLR